jgi:hypothetical protein
MAPRINRTIAALLTALALGAATTAPAALAKHGADDPAGHHVGDDNGGGKGEGGGADDPAGHR